MKHFLYANRIYFTLFFLLVLTGAVVLIATSPGDVILFASAHRTDFFNLFFTYGTRLGEEAVYVFLVVLFLFYRLRYSVIIALSGLVTMVISFSSKAFFLHDRPSVFFRKLKMFDQINLVEGVELHTGATSFPSGHTMSAFALFSLLAFLLPQRYKAWSIALFGVACLVATSRIYLVQHFAKDVYFGAWFGLAIAIALYYVFRQRFSQDPAHWLNRPLFPWAENLPFLRPKKERV